MIAYHAAINAGHNPAQLITEYRMLAYYDPFDHCPTKLSNAARDQPSAVLKATMRAGRLH
jgi:hypothetical protein